MNPSELDIECAIVDLLALDDWRCFKMEHQFSEKKRKSVGENGMPDRLCIRYGFCQYVEDGPAQRAAEVIWLELKRLDKRGKSTKVAQHQKDWHTLERKRGGLVLVAGQDFPASIEGFKEWYKTSGLMRNKIL